MTYAKRGLNGLMTEDAGFFAWKKRDVAPGHLKFPKRTENFQTT
jgi:hypothetical protein